MIITCESCTTRFQLPDDRVPEGGVRVRCSRCRHAFFVKPGPEQGDPVEAAVASAVAEHAPAPEPEGQPPHPEASPAPSADESWEFNHEAPSSQPEPGLVAARRAVDDLLGGSPSADLALPDPDPLGLGSDSLDLGSDVDGDIDALLDTGTPGDAPSPSGLEVAGLDDPAPESGETEIGGREPAGADLGEGPAGAGIASGELGSPEDWDFLDEPEPARDVPAPAVAPMRIALGRIGETPRPPVEIETEPSRAGVWLSRAAQGVGWLVFAVLVAGVLHRGLWLGSEAPAQLTGSQSLEGFELTELRGRWIDNAAVGRIYVVSGSLRGTGGVSTPGTRIAVRLLDADGQVLVEPATFLGAPLPAAWLRELHPDELRRLAESVRPESAPAGATRAFSAVVSRVPGRAARFDLVALAPEPATPTPDARAAGGEADAPAVEGAPEVAS